MFSLLLMQYSQDTFHTLTGPRARLPNLLHFCIDSRPTHVSTPVPPNSTSLLSRLLTDVLLPSSPSLHSLSIRLADRETKIPDLWIEDMLKAFGGTLQKISFGNCGVGKDSLRKISKMCPELGRLELAIPSKEIVGLDHLMFDDHTDIRICATISVRSHSP